MYQNHRSLDINAQLCCIEWNVFLNGGSVSVALASIAIFCLVIYYLFSVSGLTVLLKSWRRSNASTVSLVSLFWVVVMDDDPGYGTWLFCILQDIVVFSKTAPKLALEERDQANASRLTGTCPWLAICVPLTSSVQFYWRIVIFSRGVLQGWVVVRAVLKRTWPTVSRSAGAASRRASRARISTTSSQPLHSH